MASRISAGALRKGATLSIECFVVQALSYRCFPSREAD